MSPRGQRADSRLLDGRLPEGFTRSVVTIGVGGSLACSASTWQDALLVVARGAIDVEASDGSRTRFCTGAVLVVAELPLCRLHNGGPQAVEIVTVRRTSQIPAQLSIEPPA